MNKILKRMAAGILTGALCLTAFAGCGSTGSGSQGGSSADGETTGKKFVIGVAEAQANDEVTTRRAYFENFIAPTYNVEFIFSEVL